MSEALFPSSARVRAPFVESRKIRVLIVDEDRPSRLVCASYCDLFDHASQGARNLGEALAALRREAFDVVALSVHMTAVGGMAAMRAIRALPSPAGEVPIVALAAAGRGDEAQRWRAAGYAAVVAKPVSAARFHAALRSARLADWTPRHGRSPAE